MTCESPQSDKVDFLPHKILLLQARAFPPSKNYAYPFGCIISIRSGQSFMYLSDYNYWSKKIKKFGKTITVFYKLFLYLKICPKKTWPDINSDDKILSFCNPSNVFKQKIIIYQKNHDVLKSFHNLPLKWLWFSIFFLTTKNPFKATPLRVLTLVG